MTLRIRDLRKAKGWSQEHLAALARISRSQLAMIEAGTRPANTLRLAAIAEALGVAPEDLFASDHDEFRLMQMIRSLGAEDRAALLLVVEAMASRRLNG